MHSLWWSVDELRKLLNNKDAYNKLLQSHDQVNIQNNVFQGQVTRDDLWRHVTVIRRPNEGGGNLRWRCNFCQKEYTGSHTRLKEHLLKIAGRGIAICAKSLPQPLREVQQLVEEAALRAESQGCEMFFYLLQWAQVVTCTRVQGRGEPLIILLQMLSI